MRCDVNQILVVCKMRLSLCVRKKGDMVDFVQCNKACFVSHAATSYHRVLLKPVMDSCVISIRGLTALHYMCLQSWALGS